MEFEEFKHNREINSNSAQSSQKKTKITVAEAIGPIKPAATDTSDIKHPTDRGDENFPST